MSLYILLFWFIFGVNQALAANTENASLTCSLLASSLGSQVSYPNSTIYTAESIGSASFPNAGYFSYQAASQLPTCRVTPLTAGDVSTAIKILVAQNQKFAIRSGGHMPWRNASNIDNGVTIDLSALNQIQLIDSKDGKLAKIGPAARGVEIYNLLDPQGLTIAGPRAESVALGGFLLGGGLSFLAPKVGFSCDTVLEYEIVLADGKIVTATANSKYNDLFLALRGGGNNFGIVTSFTMQTYEIGPIWGGSILSQNNGPDDALPHYTALYNFIEHARSREDDDAAVIHSHAYIPQIGLRMISNFLTNTGGHPDAPIFHNFTHNLPSLPGGPSLTNTASLVKQLSASNPHGNRQLMATTTFKNDIKTMQAVKSAFDTMFDGFAGIPGLLITFSLQPIPKNILKVSDKAGGDSLGLNAERGNLVMCSIDVMWGSDGNVTADALAEKKLPDTADQWLDMVHVVTHQLKTGDDFVYMNYALNTQDPILGYGRNSENHLQKVSRKYDPQGVWQNLVPGGFKLWR